MHLEKQVKLRLYILENHENKGKVLFPRLLPPIVTSSKQILFSNRLTVFKAKKYLFQGDVKLQNTHLPDTLVSLY